MPRINPAELDASVQFLFKSWEENKGVIGSPIQPPTTVQKKSSKSLKNIIGFFKGRKGPRK